jgi:hypothetical protein
VINTYNVDYALGLINPVDHPVWAATCGAVAEQLASRRLANVVRTVQQWPGQELGDRCSDRQWQAARRPFNEDTASR